MGVALCFWREWFPKVEAERVWTELDERLKKDRIEVQGLRDEARAAGLAAKVTGKKRPYIVVSHRQLGVLCVEPDFDICQGKYRLNGVLLLTEEPAPNWPDQWQVRHFQPA